MITGIYILRFKDNSVYIGQSKDIYRRYSSHCNKLIKGTHSNIKLLNKYTLYGLPSLEILLECDKNDLNNAEVEAIEIFDSINNGLNIAPAAGEFPVLNGEANGFSKYSNEQIINITKYLSNNLDQPLKTSANLLNIHYSTVKNIANGTSHKWLAEIIPNEYNKLLSYKGKRKINTIANKGNIRYILSPEGIKYCITNMAEFARQYNLNSGALGEVLRGNSIQHKGWTLAIK